ncbi:MAG: hypothetical protein RQ757_00530 [Pseudomonadales bacterium]|nr:hypothetical protein [Pseudomonadales bacterium]
MATVVRRLSIFLIMVTAISAASLSQAQFNTEILALQTRWAEVNYQTEGKEQIAQFEALISEAEKVTAENPRSAEAWIWSGIIKSTYAGARGGIGALSAAKGARADLEKAIGLNPEAMNGSAYATLGVLYLNVPGWPLAFGDEDKGVELIEKALALAPNDIDNNYFYAEYLLSEKKFDRAERHLMQALAAAPRPGRALADTGRREEIQAMLEQVKAKR